MAQFSTIAENDFLENIKITALKENVPPSRAIIDTGSAVNIIRKSFADSLGHPIDCSKAGNFHDVRGFPLQSLGTVNLHFRLLTFDEERTETFHVLGPEYGYEESTRIILGAGFVKRFLLRV